MNKHPEYRGIFLMRIRQVAVAGLLATIPLTATATDSLRLHDAVKSADAAALQTAVANAASLDARDNQGRTVPTVAIEAGNWNTISMLLAAGASPDVSDRLGRAPLHYATAAPAKIARSLIQANADVDSRNAGGIAALMLAAGKERRDIVELLLDANVPSGALAFGSRSSDRRICCLRSENRS